MSKFRRQRDPIENGRTEFLKDFDLYGEFEKVLQNDCVAKHAHDFANSHELQGIEQLMLVVVIQSRAFQNVQDDKVNDALEDINVPKTFVIPKGVIKR